MDGLGWVWTTFNEFQWDLNYANPAVFGEMLDIDCLGYRDDTENILGEQLFRPDHRIDVIRRPITALTVEHQVIIQLHGADKADRFNIGNAFHRPAGDDVCLVTGGTGDEKILGRCLGLFQGTDIGAAAADITHIEMTKPLRDTVMFIEDGDIVVSRRAAI